MIISLITRTNHWENISCNGTLFELTLLKQNKGGVTALITLDAIFRYTNLYKYYICTPMLAMVSGRLCARLYNQPDGWMDNTLNFSPGDAWFKSHSNKKKKFLKSHYNLQQIEDHLNLEIKTYILMYGSQNTICESEKQICSYDRGEWGT